MLQPATRLLRLGLEAHIVGHLGAGPSAAVAAPLLWQKQAPIEKDGPPSGGIGEQSRHLTVLDLAPGATILLLDAHRADALLGDAGLIQDGNRLWVTKALDDELLHAVARGLRIPRNPVEQALHPVGCPILDHLG
jgi:hypothetical protein